jgi:hypothetical protein
MDTMAILLSCQMQLTFGGDRRVNRVVEQTNQAVRQATASVIRCRVEPTVFAGKLVAIAAERNDVSDIMRILRVQSLSTATEMAATPVDPREHGWTVASVQGSITILQQLAIEAVEAGSGPGLEERFMARVLECTKRKILRYQEAYCVFRASTVSSCVSAARQYEHAARFDMITRPLYGKLLFELFEHLQRKGVEEWIMVLAGE